MKNKKYILILFLITLVSACSSLSNKKNNLSEVSLEEEYLKYREDFFDNHIDKNVTIKYFEGSYSEGASSSFEPSVPSGYLNKEDALKQNTYFKVIYNNGKQIKGIFIESGVIYMLIYYDLKGRIIKRYNYYDNTFRLIKYHGEESLDRIYCYDEEKYCRKEHLSREENENEHKEKIPLIIMENKI